MALHSAFGELDQRLARLGQALEMLQWAVVQGQPNDGDGNALLDQYDATALDLMGLSNEARDGVGEGLRASQGSVDLIVVRDALVTATDRYNRLWARLCADAFSIEGLDRLNVVRRSGTEWRNWADGVSDALGQCPSGLFEVGQALLLCWEDLLQGLSLPTLSLHVIGSGRQSAPSSRGE